MLTLQKAPQLLADYKNDLQVLITKNKSFSDNDINLINNIKHILDDLKSIGEKEELSLEQSRAIEGLGSDLEVRKQFKNLIALSDLDIQSKINLQKFLIEIKKTTVKIGDSWNYVSLNPIPMHFPNELMRDEFAKAMDSSVTLKNGQLFITGKPVWSGGPYDDEMPGEFVFETKTQAKKFTELLQLENFELQDNVVLFNTSLPMTCVLKNEEAKRQEELQLLEMKNQKIEEMVVLSTNTASFFNKVDLPIINKIADKIICSDKPDCTVKSTM